MLRKLKRQIPGEPLAARYSCCQGPVPGRRPAVEKHCTRHIFQQFFSLWPCSPTLAIASSFLRFLDYTRRATVVRTPLDRWSSRHRDLYLTTHGTCNRQQKKIHAPDGIRTHILSRRAAADLHLRPRGHRDRHISAIDGSQISRLHFFILTSFYLLIVSDNTLTRDRHPCLRRDSNPQSKQANSCRPAP